MIRGDSWFKKYDAVFFPHDKNSCLSPSLVPALSLDLGIAGPSDGTLHRDMKMPFADQLSDREHI